MNEESTSPLAAPAVSAGGGSAAGQAYRAQLAQEAAARAAVSADADPNPQPAPFARGSDARTAERKKVMGRARIVLQGSDATLSGKMVDMSLTGVCVLVDDMVPVKKMCTLECDIFQNGTRQVFRVPAVSVYGVLASGHGFKVGFQFGPRSQAALQTIAELLK